MYIDRILAPIETLGPGKRLVIWTKGCSKHCKGCANPELWDTYNAKEYAVKDIVKIIENLYKEIGFDGITISGGDPLEQPAELLQLVEGIQTITQDIMVYTGYTLEEIENRWNKADVERLKRNVSVLIDGPYVEEYNYSDIVLKGSANQNIIFFKESFTQLYEEYLKNGRKIQNVFMGDQLVSVGIHNRKGERS